VIGIAKKLTDIGVLTINKRNADYMLRYNPRGLYPLVDDKLLTKRLAVQHGIAVPELYGVVEVERQVREMPQLLARHPDFVVKPAHGSGGKGILVISGRLGDNFRKVGGRMVTWGELNHHMFNILSGLYSLGGQPDAALIEYRVEFDPIFEQISYQGVPDIRMVVFLGVPAMSMVRLPTRESDGKANLHQGAVGAGIDIAAGRTVAAVWGGRIVTEHPDTQHALIGVEIPGWEELLALAARCGEITGLGYQGVDIVLDREKGPLVLELNARPGLNIQIANNAGLLRRLNLVEERASKLATVSERVAFAMDHFRSSTH